MNEFDAFQIIKKISEGGDPYTEGATSSNNPANNPQTVKALCIAITALVKDTDDHVIKETSRNLEDEPTGNISLSDNEKNIIESMLKKTKYNKTQAAKNLGLSLRQFRYKLEKYNIY